MLEPIKVTNYGEHIVAPPAHEGTGFDPTTLDPMTHKITGPFGIHRRCEGIVDLRDVSDTHNVIVCRRCALRLYIPDFVKTWSDLSDHFKIQKEAI